jgi:C1A family cysteine protease
MKYFFGYIKDKIDNRDFFYFPIREHIETRPKQFDMTDKMPPVYDQGQLGSCTANAINGVVEYLNMKQHKETWTPSRLFVYYNEREMEGTVNQDSGAMIRDGIKSINAQGVCKEIPTWPYDISQFTVKPSKQAYTEAMLHQSLKYAKVFQDTTNIETRLSQGYPITCGIMVYSSFMSAEKTGVVPMPKKVLGFTLERLLGGHAIMLVGYDSIKRVFICRNSWGDKWGNKGYFTIPYDYILSSKLSSDFWTITLME